MGGNMELASRPFAGQPEQVQKYVGYQGNVGQGQVQQG